MFFSGKNWCAALLIAAVLSGHAPAVADSKILSADPSDQGDWIVDEWERKYRDPHLVLFDDALAPRTADGTVAVSFLDQNFILIRMALPVVFDPSSTTVSSAFRTDGVVRLGAALAKYHAEWKARQNRPLRIYILGHSDGADGSTVTTGSADERSLALAQALMKALAPHLPGGINAAAHGRGNDDPVCVPIEKASCGPLNRRIELLVERVH